MKLDEKAKSCFLSFGHSVRKKIHDLRNMIEKFNDQEKQIKEKFNFDNIKSLFESEHDNKANGQVSYSSKYQVFLISITEFNFL